MQHMNEFDWGIVLVLVMLVLAFCAVMLIPPEWIQALINL